MEPYLVNCEVYQLVHLAAYAELAYFSEVNLTG